MFDIAVSYMCVCRRCTIARHSCNETGFLSFFNNIQFARVWPSFHFRDIFRTETGRKPVGAQAGPA